MNYVSYRIKNTISPKTIKQHFEEFKKAKTSHGVADRDVYNFDEIGFKVGYEKLQTVVIKEEKACIVLENLENKDFILLIKCVSDDRLVILNMVILNGKSHLEKFFLNNNLDKNITIVVSDTTYKNNKLSLYWLEYFDKNIWTKRRRM